MCLKKLILSLILCHTFISIAVHPLTTEDHLSDFAFLPMFKIYHLQFIIFSLHIDDVIQDAFNQLIL